MNVETSMNVDNGEFMKFKADEDAMVNHMIHSQNGTAPTAIRELVMNGIDKDADRIDIEISETHFRVLDTGIGFASREDVEKHFRTFGTPHQEGDATFGRFRIGRGQIMKLAKAQWHSHEFRMVTDIQGKGNGMVLYVEPEKAIQGCEVSGEFYEPIRPHETVRIEQDITDLVRYLSVPVFLNGVQVNDTSNIAWDYEDDDVKVLWEPAGEYRIKLYSIGVYVKDLPIYQYGISAHVVTKRAFDLNMARNEISATDPLWHKIEDLVRKYGQKKSREKASRGQLDDAGRSALIRQVACGETPLSEIMNLSLLKDIRGHSVKMNQLRYASTQSKAVTVAMKEDHNMGERLATRGRTLVLHPDNLQFWGCRTMPEFFDKLKALAANDPDPSLYTALDSLDIQKVEVLSKDIDDTSEEIDEKTLTQRQKAALIAAQKVGGLLPKFIREYSGERINYRSIRVGKSDTNEAWTDGYTTIWVNIDLLKNLHKERYAMDYLAGILLHEYGHAFENSKGHDHDFDFHHAFHEVVILKDKGVLGRVAEQGRRQYVASLGQRLERLPKWAYDAYQTEKVIEVELERMPTGEVSKAAEILLKASGAKVDMKPSKAILMMEASRTSNIPSKIITAFWKVLRKDKRLAVDRNQAFDQIGREFMSACRELTNNGMEFSDAANQMAPERDAKTKRVWDQFEAALAGWLKDNDQDESLAYQITSVNCLTDFLNLLCSDVDSNFTQYSYNHKVTEYVVGGREYTFTGTRDQASGLINHQTHSGEEIIATKMAAGAEKRLDAVQLGMFQSLMMIENAMERDSTAKKLLAEDSYKAFQKYVLSDRGRRV